MVRSNAEKFLLKSKCVSSIYITHNVKFSEDVLFISRLVRFKIPYLIKYRGQGGA